MSSITKETAQFLTALKKNNNRDWFNANKEKFVAANENFIEFAGGLIDSAKKFDEAVEHLSAKDTVFRIYRDTRFAKDKSPYKVNFGMHLMPGGKGCGKAGYYFHFAHRHPASWRCAQPRPGCYQSRARRNKLQRQRFFEDCKQ